jgi:excisionase family DNA binding protein
VTPRFGMLGGMTLLTIKETAELLHLTPETVRRKILRGELPGAMKLGRTPQSRVRVDEAELEAWLDEPLPAGPAHASYNEREA